MLRTPGLRWLCLLLVLVGFALSGYLLQRSLVLLSDSHPESGDICSEVFGAGCDATLLDRSSWVLGIPLAGWGVVYYVALAALLLLAFVMGEAFAPQAMLAALFLSVAGLTNSAVLAVSMFSGASAFCPLCVVVQGINLLLVPALYMATGRKFAVLWRELINGVAYLLGRRAEQPTEAAWRTLGLYTVGLIALVAYQWVYVQVTLRQALAQEETPDDVLEEFLAQAITPIPAADDDIRLGPAKATVTMVIFSDFQCPHCARVAATLASLQEQHAEKLAIVFKHYPLSSSCNEHLETDLHPRACALAWAAEAAHQQDKFWAFHDACFAKQGASFDDAEIAAIAGTAGLDLPQFAIDVEAAATREAVQADISLAAKLGVRGTPTCFLNGRRVPSLAGQSLEILVEHELHPRR